MLPPPRSVSSQQSVRMDDECCFEHARVYVIGADSDAVLMLC